MALEKTGVEFVAAKVNQYIRDLTRADQVTAKISGTIEKTVKSVNSASKGKGGLEGVGNIMKDVSAKFESSGRGIADVLELVGGNVGNLGRRMNAGGNLIADFSGQLGALPPQALAVAGAVAAATAAVAAFVALGVRGASTQGIIDGFKQTGVSLEELRNAANRTVSDLQLMTNTNLALAGATGLVRDEFANKLPQLLQVARAQARETGQSVDFLFESLVTGIKRASPLLIDNTGLVLKVGQANEAYAQSLGKTVDQLTDAEKQVAVLNATLEAGAPAVERLGNAGETAAEKLNRIGARITNTFDKLAFAIQPAFEAVLDVVDGVFAFIEDTVNRIAPVIQFIAKAFQAVFTIVGEVLGAIITPIRDVLQRVIDFIVGQSKAFAIGGARMFGAFVNGVAFVINRSLLPLIAAAAQAIADFLVGQSPPPKGPLKDIDKGGQNVMLAWIEGFTGVSIEPVENVAARVTATMGKIAEYSIQQVESRIKSLDRALLPFQNQLAIVEAQFNALKDPAEKALDAIDRQIEKLQQAIVDGDQEAAQLARSLDERRALLEGQLGFNQAIVDQAQIQLSLVQAQQAEERVLLAIQRQRLGNQDEEAKKAGKVAKANKEAAGSGTAPKEKKATGEAPDPASLAGSTTSFDPNQFGANAGFIPDLQVEGGFLGDAATAFLEPLIQSGELATTQGLLGDIQSSIGRINKGSTNGIGDRIASAFENLPNSLGKVFGEAANAVKEFLFGEGENSLQGLIRSLPEKIPTFLANLPNILGLHLLTPFGLTLDGIETALFGEAGFEASLKLVPAKVAAALFDLGGKAGVVFQQLVQPFVEAVTAVGNFLVGSDENSLPTKIGNFIAIIPSTFKNLAGEAGVLFANFTQPFRDAVDSVIGFFFGDGADGSVTLQSAISSIALSIGEWAGGIGDSILEFINKPIGEHISTLLDWLTNPEREDGGFAATIATFFSGDPEKEGSIGWFLAQAVAAFAAMPTKIGDALKSVGSFVWEKFGLPIINIVNYVIDQIQDFLNALPATVNAVANEFGLGIRISLLSIPKLNTSPPGFLGGSSDVPGAFAGGLFDGLVKVGERGTEYVASGQQFAVFPNRVAKSIDELKSVFAQPYQQPVYSTSNSTYNNGNDSYHYDDRMINTFQEVRDAKDYIARQAIQRLRRGRR